MSIQEMEDLKQHYLDEMLSLSNDLQIKDYRNEKIDIRLRRECENMIDELKDIIFELPLSVAITPDLSIADSLIMGNEHLSTIPEKESDEVIKSSGEDLVTIPSEFEDTSESNSDCDLRSCDDFSPINVYEEKSMTFTNPLFDLNGDFTSSDDESLSDEDVLEDNVKIYSNPLFEFDDEYISSNVNPLFDEVLEDTESEDSYVFKLNEPDLLVTPLSAFNEDEYIEDDYYDSKGDIIYLESLLIKDTIPNLFPELYFDHEPKCLKDEPKLDNLTSMVKVFDPVEVRRRRLFLSLVSVVLCLFPVLPQIIKNLRARVLSIVHSSFNPSLAYIWESDILDLID
ncbi:hypothetical protein Tco_0193995 [Tanacetum coccineum]